MRRGTGPQGRGHTIIELLVAIAVLSVLVAMVAPEFGGTLATANLRAAGRRLAAAARLASSQAITVGRPHRLRIDLGTGEYWIESRPRAPEADEGFDGGEIAAGAPAFVPARELPGAQGRLEGELVVFAAPRAESTPQPAARSTRQGLAASSGRATGARHAASAAILFRADRSTEGPDLVLRDRDGFGLALRVHPVTARVEVIELEREPPP